MAELFLRRLALAFHILQPPEGMSPELYAEIDEMARKVSQELADRSHRRARDFYPEMLEGILKTVGSR